MSFRQLIRFAHNRAASSLKESKIYLSKDETCFISYHPTSDHPYEFTKPMTATKSKENSYLKVDSRNMITKTPNLEQVQNLTYTPKSYWRQDEGKTKRDRYRKHFDEKDVRKGLVS